MITYDIHEEPVWKNMKEVVIEKLLTIGSNDIEESNYIFGDITDIATDNEDNVYIVDFRYFKASKFTSDGKFIRSYGNGRGQGPGEFERPNLICVDSRGNVYISDYNYRSISIFDQSNRFIRSFRTEKLTLPLQDMVTFKDLSLYVGLSIDHFASEWNDGIFQKYSLPEGKYVGSLGSSDWFKINWRTFLAANSICIDKANDNIIISHTSPYKIEVFSNDGLLLRSFGRKCSYFDNFYETSGYPMADGASLRMTCLPDGKIVNVIRHIYKSSNNTNEIERYFDFFDEEGNYLITIPEEEFGIQGRYNLTLDSDSKGHIWISFAEPFPHIAKFKIEFRDKDVN